MTREGEQDAIRTVMRTLNITGLVACFMACLKWVMKTRRAMPAIFILYISLSLFSLEAFRAISLFYNFDAYTMPHVVCVVQGAGIYTSCMLSLCYCYAFAIVLYLFVVKGFQRKRLRARICSSHILSVGFALIGGGVGVALDVFQPGDFTCTITNIVDIFFLCYLGVFVALPPSVWTCYKILVLLWKEQQSLNSETVKRIMCRMASFLVGFCCALVLVIGYLPATLYFDSHANWLSYALDIAFAGYPTLFGLYFTCTTGTTQALKNFILCRLDTSENIVPSTLHEPLKTPSSAVTSRRHKKHVDPDYSVLGDADPPHPQHSLYGRNTISMNSDEGMLGAYIGGGVSFASSTGADLESLVPHRERKETPPVP